MKKEKCSKCGSTEFSKATDKSNKHYCSKCQHIWVPGMENLTRPDLLLKQAQTENVELKAEITKLRKQIAEFTAIADGPGNEKPETPEIFD